MIKTFFPFLLSAIILLGCAEQKNNTENNSSYEAPSAAYTGKVSMVQTVETFDAQRAPNFTWRDESGTTVSFASFSQGKPVLVNFWATWCGPCVKEMPDLVALSEEFSARGGLVLGISVDKDSDVLNLVAEFAKEHNVKYPLIIDNGELEKAFGGLRGIPTTFYVDKNGMIAKKLIGLQSKEKFTQEFNALL